ncbi:MAG: hypothetical protein HN730_08885 [Bdellovibrionales bacterium]|jgi:hypothetical protein|nr:hypothetical protein [Bdellovibrionales bacterium]
MNQMQDGNSVGSLLEIQKSLIEGCLLGDGYMRCKSNAHLQITHSINQKKYVDWKYQLLKDYVLTPPKPYKGNGGRVGYRFFTRSLPQFTRFYNRYYKEGKKVIPRDLQLNPFSLAVWFMDDGSKSRNSCYLNTQQFSLSDQNYLKLVLQKQFGIKPNLDKDKIYLRLRFSVTDTKKLKKIIQQFVLPELQYKFPI